ncbi:aldehyde dehydrogenase family protein [Streptomyces sp. NPDC001020]
MAVAPGDTRFEVAGHLTENFIGGQWVAAQSGQRRADLNPADLSDVLGEFVESGGVDVDLAVEEAHRALDHWRGIGPIERAAFLTRALRILEGVPRSWRTRSPVSRASC